MSFPVAQYFSSFNNKLQTVTASHHLSDTPRAQAQEQPMLRRSYKCLDCTGYTYNLANCHRCFAKNVVENKSKLTPEVLKEKVSKRAIRKRESSYLQFIINKFIPFISPDLI